jgi:MtrB/PioB family decaheme-associated outer membrane protein
MRTTWTFVVVALLAAVGASAQEQDASAPQNGAAPGGAPASQTAPVPQVFVPTAAQIAAPEGFAASFDVGTRFTKVTGDRYRFERYRDFSEGLLMEHFVLDRQGSGWTVNAVGDRLGAEDARISASFSHGSKVRASFVWDQIPLMMSGDTRTLYAPDAAGAMRLSDAIRGSIQAGGSTLAQWAGGAEPLSIESRRDTAVFDFSYNATRELAVKLGVRYTRRDGTYPQTAPFGFSDVTELVAPLDQETTDVNGGLEWANTRGMVRVGYEASDFRNNAPTLVWDNPLKLTDSTASNNYSNGLGGSRGRMAMAPNSQLRGINAAGSVKLPANSRFNANMTLGSWLQNDPLLPVTINSAVPAASLPRQTLEAEARTLALNLGFTSHPSQYVFLAARFRSYDFDNRTPVFHTPISVVFDQTVHEGAETEPLSFSRYNFDADASFTPVPLTALRVGYSRSTDERTWRIFETTTEHVARASLDSSAGGFVTVRAIVERGQRRGTGFDEHLLLAVNEQLSLRHYDVADRDRNRFTGLVQLTPVDAFGLTASASYGQDDYLNSTLGLRNNKNTSYSVTADVAPGSRVAASLSYTKDRYTALQNSHSTLVPGTSFDIDHRRDWSTDSADNTETVALTVDLMRLVPRVDFSLAFEDSRSRATYVYRLPADGTLVAPIQLPAVTYDLRSTTADLRYHLSRQVAIGLLGWFDKYDVDDYAMNESTLNRLDLPGSLLLGYVFRPYSATSATVRIIWTW